MRVISELHTLVEDATVDYLQTVFSSVAEPLTILLKSVALVALLFIALNHLFQFRQINYSQYFTWAIRFLLIYSFATLWVNFEGIYTLVREIPEDYGGLLIKGAALQISSHRTDILDPGRCSDAYACMDEFNHALIWMGQDFFRDTSISDIPMSIKNIGMGIVMTIIGTVWTAVSAIIVLIADVGFMMALSLAPLAILTLMMDQTKQYFESWCRFSLSFTIIPLLLVALTAIVLFIAGELLVKSNAGSDNKEAYLEFGIIMIGALVLLFKLPEMGMAISGTAVAAAGTGVALAAKATGTRMAGSAMRGAAKAPMAAYSGARAAKTGIGAMREAHSSGAGLRSTFTSGFRGMQDSATIRRQRRSERLSNELSGSKAKLDSTGQRAARTQAAKGSISATTGGVDPHALYGSNSQLLPGAPGSARAAGQGRREGKPIPPPPQPKTRRKEEGGDE